MSTVEVHRQITGDEIAHTFEEEATPKVDLGIYAFEVDPTHDVIRAVHAVRNPDKLSTLSVA